MKIYNYLFALMFVGFALSGSLSTAQVKMAPAGHKMLTPNNLQWADAPPALPKGAKLAVLDGNPMGAGMYTVRLKFPAGYMLPAHSHPVDEFITVISGAFKMGFGDKYQVKDMKVLPPGSFSVTPAKVNHFAGTDEETIVQIHGMAPFAITYVNPADDPRNKK